MARSGLRNWDFGLLARNQSGNQKSPYSGSGSPSSSRMKTSQRSSSTSARSDSSRSFSSASGDVSSLSGSSASARGRCRLPEPPHVVPVLAGLSVISSLAPSLLGFRRSVLVCGACTSFLAEQKPSTASGQLLYVCSVFLCRFFAGVFARRKSGPAEATEPRPEVFGRPVRPAHSMPPEPSRLRTAKAMQP